MCSGGSSAVGVHMLICMCMFTFIGTSIRRLSPKQPRPSDLAASLLVSRVGLDDHRPCRSCRARRTRRGHSSRQRSLHRSIAQATAPATATAAAAAIAGAAAPQPPPPHSARLSYRDERPAFHGFICRPRSLGLCSSALVTPGDVSGPLRAKLTLTSPSPSSQKSIPHTTNQASSRVHTPA